MRCSRERKIRELKATILEQGKEIIALQKKLKKSPGRSCVKDNISCIEVISVNGVEYVNKKQLQDYKEEHEPDRNHAVPDNIRGVM